MSQDTATHGVDRWFVQVNGQMLGPMSSLKVLTKLIDGEIEVIHRVSRDRKTWAAICNTPFFEQFIQSHIDDYNGKSKSVGSVAGMSQTTSDFRQIEALSEIRSIQSATAGISEQLEHAKQLEEISANIQKLLQIVKLIQVHKKTVIREVIDNKDGKHPDDEDEYIPAKGRGFSLSDLFGKGKSPLFTLKPSWQLFSIIAMVVGLTGYLWTYQRREAEALENQEKMRMAVAAATSGEYAKAMQSYRELTIDENTSGEDLLALANAHLKGQDPKTSQQLVKQAMGRKLSAEGQARAHTLNSEIARQSGDTKTAESELELAAKQKEFFATFHNLGVLKLKAGKAKDAEPLFLKALQIAKNETGIPSDREPTALGLFEAALTLDLQERAKFKAEGKAPPSMHRLHGAQAILIELLKQPTVRQEELLVAASIAGFYLGERESFQLHALDLMDRLPNLKEKKQQPDLDYDLATFRTLYKRCTEVYNQETTNDFTAAFYASCLTRSHGASQAEPFAKYAYSLRPTDAVYAGLYAYLLVQLNKLPVAQAVLSQDPERWSASKLAAIMVEDIKTRVPAAAPGVAPAAPGP